MLPTRSLTFLLALLGGAPALALPVEYANVAATAADLQATVNTFRATVGALNANVAGSFGSGRREINWDGVPNDLAAPNSLPSDFFSLNSISPRGVEFSTPGSGFQVSANAGGVAAVEFGSINASYPALFAPFSTQRLFSPIGSNVTDVRFFVPGTGTAALTDAFGVVFSDVDLAGTTSLEFFDAANASLGIHRAPAFSGRNETFSFLGVRFTEGKVISRVRITTGNMALASGNNESAPSSDPFLDLVVMDDFIFGKPVRATVPEPATGWLLALAGGMAWLARRRRTPPSVDAQA